MLVSVKFFWWVSTYRGKGKESPMHLGRGRRAFSLLFAREWGIEADGVGPHGGHRPGASSASVCRALLVCFPTRIWRECHERASHKDEGRSGSKAASPAFRPSHQNSHEAIGRLCVRLIPKCFWKLAQPRSPALNCKAGGRGWAPPRQKQFSPAQSFSLHLDRAATELRLLC